MDIEEIAVLAVRNEIVKYSDTLVAYIDTKEKTPMWDGYIYVYRQNSKYKANNEFEGKIGVQVKGKTVKKLSNGNSKYSIKVDYLRAYQKDKKGILLFVVEIIDYAHTKLFYANLLPVDLEEILNKVKENQEEISIDIKPIKEKSSSSLKMICLNFLKNANEQINIAIKSIDEIKDIKEIKIPIIGEEKYMEDYLFNNDIYSYAIDKETNEKIALPKLKELEKFSTNKVNVSVSGREYYNNITFVKNKNEEYIIYGKSTKIYLSENKITFKIKGNVYERIRDINFIVNLINSKAITIDGKNIVLPVQVEDKQEKEYISNIKNDLIRLEKIKCLFDKFNIKFNIDLDNLSDKDWRNLDLFIHINDGKPTKQVQESKLYNIEIANYKIAFIALVDENKNIKVYNYFSDLSNVVKVFYYDENEKEILVSPYINMSKKNLLEYSNVDIDIIKETFNSLDSKEETIERYNLWMLEVIKAYDESNNIKFLELADYINERILEHRDNAVDVINKMQIVKRKRALNYKEKDLIYDLKDAEDDLIIQCGIAILLDNKSDYERFFSKLSENEKNAFKEFPIYNLLDKEDI